MGASEGFLDAVGLRRNVSEKDRNFLEGIEKDFPEPTGQSEHDGLNRLQARFERFQAEQNKKQRD